MSYDRTKTHTQSTLAMFRQCPRLYKARCVDGLDPEPTWEMRIGTAFHEILWALTNGHLWNEIKDKAARSVFAAELAPLFAATEDYYGDPPVLVPNSDIPYWAEDPVCLTDEMLLLGASGIDRTFFAGTPDLIYRDGYVLIVRDYKTGQKPPPYGENIAQDWQLRCYAFLALQIFRPEVVILQKHYILHGMRESDSLAPECFDDVWPEILAIVGEIEARKRNGEFPATQNEYCPSCPIRSDCPIYREAGALVQSPPSFLPEMQTPEQALRYISQRTMINAVLNDADARLRRILDESGPIPDGQGNVYGLWPALRA